MDRLLGWLAVTEVLTAIGLLRSLIGSLVVHVVFTRVLGRLAARSRSEVDDLVLRGIRAPAALSLLAIGLGRAILREIPEGTTRWALSAGLTPLVVGAWSQAIGWIAARGLAWLARQRER